MGKKFGLKEAQVLASEPDAHLPTVKATLKILGVPNVVGKQVSQLVSRTKDAVAQANRAIANLRTRDMEDEQDTIKVIGDLRTNRDSRAKENTKAITTHRSTVTDKQDEIARLEDLAKKFA